MYYLIHITILILLLRSQTFVFINQLCDSEIFVKIEETSMAKTIWWKLIKVLVCTLLNNSFEKKILVMVKYITVNLQWSRQYSIHENIDKNNGV